MVLTSHVKRICSGTLFDFIPPFIIVGVIVILERALIIEASRGSVSSSSVTMSSTFFGEGLCSIANVDKCSKKLVDVSSSGS